ncbi:hypothetical protein V3W47_14230 [Deinococcus sp. YIM 134068]|uniref:hypothetical protein n=1 Tax=Deinococcus lichenicola TaxID=3118910 RepID=UPI002F929ACB
MTLNRLSQRLRPRFPDLVLVICAAGFAFLAVELVLYDHFQRGTQIIGFAATLVGLAVTLLAFWRQRVVQGVVVALLAVLTFSGLYGANEHRKEIAEDAARSAQTTTVSVSATSTSAAPTGAPPAGMGGGSDIPILAPLSLSGLAGLTLLTVLARRRPEPSGVERVERAGGLVRTAE